MSRARGGMGAEEELEDAVTTACQVCAPAGLGVTDLNEPSSMKTFVRSPVLDSPLDEAVL